MSLNARSLARSFGSVHAVSDASITVEPGQVLGLVGPNGCGKTTTMLMAVGLLQPDSGWVEVDGKVVASADSGHPFSVDEAAAARGLIGWMPDEFGSWDALNTEQILSIFAGLYGCGDPRKRVEAVIEKLGMQDFVGKRIQTLSRGQKQRLGFARALIHQPRYLILDEPANGMDPGARLELKKFVRDFATQGAGVLVSSHVLTELEDMVDDAVFMHAGRTVASPTTSELRWRVEVLNPELWSQFAQSSNLNTGGVPFSFIADDEGAAGEIIAAASAAGVRFRGVYPPKIDLQARYLAMEGAGDATRAGSAEAAGAEAGSADGAGTHTTGAQETGGEAR